MSNNSYLAEWQRKQSSANNYNSIANQNDQEKMDNVQMASNSNEQSEGFFSKFCHPLTLSAIGGTVLVLLVLMILMLVYK